MQSALSYQHLGNAVLLLHILIVVFVIGGLVLIIAGNLRNWSWVNALWFRALHFGAILVVASEAMFGNVCPLTTLEMWLRAQGTGAVYAGGFVEHWLQTILYYEAPAWVFTGTYLLFGLIVAVIWWYFPPRYKHDA